MNEFYGFENLECWKKAKDLAVDIYRLQDDGNFSDDYGLLNDLRQSAISVFLKPLRSPQLVRK